MKTSVLVVFNLRSDIENNILGASVDWIIELHKHFDEIQVYTVHKGKTPDIEGIKWIELGGGTLFRRIRGLWRSIKCALYIITRNDQIRIFYHMNHLNAIIPGVLFRCFGIRQVLWYAHKKKSVSLWIASKVVSCIVTSATTAFPIKSNKIYEIGQPTTLEFTEKDLTKIRNRLDAVVTVGRVAKAKNLEEFIEQSSYSAKIIPRDFFIIGPITEPKYKNHLRDLAEIKKINLVFIGEVARNSVLEKMSHFKFYFCGTEQAVDKAVMEAGYMGCIILTSNKNVQKMVGLHKIIRPELLNCSLSNQIEWFVSQDDSYLQQVSDWCHEYIKENYSLKVVIRRLVTVLEESHV